MMFFTPFLNKKVLQPESIIVIKGYAWSAIMFRNVHPHEWPSIDCREPTLHPGAIACLGKCKHGCQHHVKERKCDLSDKKPY